MHPPAFACIIDLHILNFAGNDTDSMLDEGIHMEKYEDIFKNHAGLVANKWIHYFHIYDRIFAEYRQRNTALSVLEIGVDQGGSLEIWKKYFPKGTQIHGIDINPDCEKLSFSEDIFFHLGNATERVFMEKTFADIAFDVIIDDGSHTSSDVIKTFEIMFPHLKWGGIYVVEDLHSSYWQSHGGGFRKKGSSIEYFKNLVEAVNFCWITSPAGVLPDRFTKATRYRLKKTEESRSGVDLAPFIDSIAFFDSVCVIRKYACPKHAPLRSVLTGDADTKIVNCYKNEMEQVESIRRMYGDRP